MSELERQSISIAHANAMALALELKALPARINVTSDGALFGIIEKLATAATQHADALGALLAKEEAQKT